MDEVRDAVLADGVGVLDGSVMITITAPGKERLPWDEKRCAHRKPHRHSGRRGCRVEREPAEEWCATLERRWRLLRRAARGATGLRLPAGVWEPQRRGVPHMHLVVPAALGAQLARLAEAYDFGHVG